MFEDSRNCNVSTDRALVALEGVDDLVVVATQDAVLVSRQKDANGLKRLGRKKWQRAVEDIVARLRDVFLVEDVVLGGGNARKLRPLPPGTRRGDNRNAFTGGFRLWERA